MQKQVVINNATQSSYKLVTVSVPLEVVLLNSFRHQVSSGKGQGNLRCEYTPRGMQLGLTYMLHDVQISLKG